MEKFPVVSIPNEEQMYAERGGSRKRCMLRGLWYRDWHEQFRGPRNPRTGRRAKHHAQDIFAPEGSLVVAPDPGVIVGSSADTGPTAKGGHWVRLEVRNRRGQAVRTYYMSHLADVPTVRTGDVVDAGAQLGLVGRTGNADVRTCPHLHIGARRYSRGRAINIYEELVAVDPAKAPPVVAPEVTTETKPEEKPATDPSREDDTKPVVIPMPPRLPSDVDAEASASDSSCSPSSSLEKENDDDARSAS